MASPEHELAGTALARLRGTAGVTALVGGRINYVRPEDEEFPQIAGVDTDLLRDDATCVDGSEITLQVHVWTRDGIDPLQDARAIGHEVKVALHHFPLPLPTNTLTTLNHRMTRIFYDRDGLTGRGVVEFRAIIQNAA